ncbi:MULTISPECIES: hypothetical protein [Mycobacteriaceae]|uniref:Uncharacterized protein n=1 Tax=Mycolicibacterium farcinogenes TaxID=1802 RepID=A0ACD1FR58_MYCFR|nr:MULTISPECIES: hypothetical protein [Mycobacteriaceae]MBN7315084.1 hypothetical protein [Mycobacteroides abscessus subsp. abscessus]QZH69549.1 hypothetical protein K6L26_31075 [Mycolicibacterium farcinogenes]
MSNNATTIDPWGPWTPAHRLSPQERAEYEPEQEHDHGGPCGSCHDYTCPSITRGGLCPETY